MAVTTRIGAVDGLKGFAILLVIYQHVYAAKLIDLTGTRIVFGYGYLSVALFYILSGYLLYVPYAMGRFTSKKEMSTKEFYKKKVLRLYPHLFVCTLTLVIFAHSLDLQYIKSALLALTFTTQFVPSQFTPIVNGGLWYLPVLVSFLLVYPALIRLMLKSKRAFFGTAITIFIGAFIVRLLGAGYFTDNPFLSPYKDSILGRMDDFLAGILLCYFMYNRQLPGRLSKIQVYMLVVFSVLLFLASNVVLSLFLRDTSKTFYAAIANNFVQLSFCGLIVATTSKGVVQKFFESKILRKLGILSYSIFLWNIPVIAATGHVRGRYVFLPPLILGIAYLYHKLVDERPLHEKKSR